MIILMESKECKDLHDSFGSSVQYKRIHKNGLELIGFIDGMSKYYNPYADPPVYMDCDYVMNMLNKFLGEK